VFCPFNIAEIDTPILFFILVKDQIYF